MIPRTDLEYEYLFVNGEFDIDMVMAKSKRKKVMSVNLSEADLIAPLNSHKMDYYNGNQKMKTIDFSSGIEDHKRYAMIVRDTGLFFGKSGTQTLCNHHESRWGEQPDHH